MADAKAGMDMDSSSPFFFCMYDMYMQATSSSTNKDSDSMASEKVAQYFFMSCLSRLVLSIGRP